MKQVNLSLETAQKMYNSGDESLKAFALENYPELDKKSLPTKWEDLSKIEGYFVADFSEIVSYSNSEMCDEHKNIFAKESQAKAVLALAQLSQLKAVYNDGWEPNWADQSSNKYGIIFTLDRINAATFSEDQCFLAFKSEELRDKFLEHFRDLIMEAKPLL